MRMPIFTAAALMLGAAATAGDAYAAGQRVKVAGEIIDSFCAISGIMHGFGTAHHQCAVWCAVGGVPVGIMGDDGKAYLILKVEADTTNVTPAKLLDIQTAHVTVDAELYVRDGVNYLLVDKIVANDGIKNLSHKEHGIVPFGE